MKAPRVVLARRILTLGAVAAALAFTPVPNTSAQTQIYGLWRDQSGGSWCGGSCSSGQQCCIISPVQPEPSPGTA